MSRNPQPPAALLQPPPVQRLPDAAARLQQLLLERHARGFLWGWRDCAMWAADGAFAATGRDPAADLRGTYYAPRQAARVMQAAGGLAALASARIGPAITPEQALDGDVALIPPQYACGRLSTDGALAIFWRRAIIAQGERSLVVLRADVALRAWRSAAAWSRTEGAVA